MVLPFSSFKIKLNSATWLNLVELNHFRRVFFLKKKVVENTVEVKKFENRSEKVQRKTNKKVKNNSKKQKRKKFFFKKSKMKKLKDKN